VEYLIRWRGYGPEDDSWSTEQECEDLYAVGLQEALETYNANQKRKKKTQKPSKTQKVAEVRTVSLSLKNGRNGKKPKWWPRFLERKTMPSLF
jgi:hypothetical protein